MKRASEGVLGELHTRLAGTLLQALDDKQEARALVQEFQDELPKPVLAFLNKVGTENPALLTVCTKFLRDNGITSVPEDSAEMSELEARLKSKRRVQVGNILTFED